MADIAGTIAALPGDLAKSAAKVLDLLAKRDIHWSILTYSTGSERNDFLEAEANFLDDFR